MLVNKSLKKLHEDNKINFNNSTIKGEHFMKIGWGMTSWECYENKWFYMKYIGKYLSGEILLTRECILNNWYKVSRTYTSLNDNELIGKVLHLIYIE
jgi:hypothetical protein